jgi:hypothetical protein
MIGRNFRKQSLQQRPQTESDALHQPGALSQTHQAQPQRHDPDQTQRDCHCRLRAIERAAGYILEPIIPATDRDRKQHQCEPNIIQHADVFSRDV